MHELWAKKNTLPQEGGAPRSLKMSTALQLIHISGLRSALTFYDVKFNLLTFF